MEGERERETERSRLVNSLDEDTLKNVKTCRNTGKTVKAF